MKVFHCDHCGHLVFFENTRCVSCGHLLAFLPDLMLVGSLDPAVATDDGRRRCRRAAGRTLSPVRELSRHAGLQLGRRRDDDRIRSVPVLPADARHSRSRRSPGHHERLVPPRGREAAPRLHAARRSACRSPAATTIPSSGLAFEFLADAGPGAPPVLTGHADGVITINVAEADDAERERRRHALGEPYRTLLGHMRHESRALLLGSR